jgi:exoribonuclease R
MEILFSSHDRQYTKWSFTNIQEKEDISLELSPTKMHFFHGDRFMISLDAPYSIKIVSSPVRSSKIAGVLILEDNKTYGRSFNQKRLLYKCIPYDSHYPIFLVPYDMKPNFSKKPTNKYILFKYDNWNCKHPYGIITETIGDVDDLNAFYEYQLYARNLNHSIKTILSKRILPDDIIEKIYTNPFYSIEDSRDKFVFSIDSLNSTDLDDAFSICRHKAPDTHLFTITVYIANVYVWIETLQLWNNLTERVSTIYLPDKKRTLLPLILSNTFCSLQAGEPRFAFAVEFTMNIKTGEFITSNPLCVKNVLIKVSKNYRYEELNKLYRRKQDTPTLPAVCSSLSLELPVITKIKEPYYDDLFNLTRMQDATIEDSHDLVAFWMKKTNSVFGEYMNCEKIGIGRIIPDLNFPANNMFSNIEYNRVYQQWKYNMKGNYVENISCNKKTQYTHITSPIRRIVDLLNQTVVLIHMQVVKETSPASMEFVQKWMNQIDFLNESTNSIRKVQRECELMYLCYTSSDILERIHEGIVFSESTNENYMVENMNSQSCGLMKKYTIYCEKLKLLSHITTEENLSVGSMISFTLFLFENEDKTKKKIRLQYYKNIQE